MATGASTGKGRKDFFRVSLVGNGTLYSTEEGKEGREEREGMIC